MWQLHLFIAMAFIWYIKYLLKRVLCPIPICSRVRGSCLSIKTFYITTIPLRNGSVFKRELGNSLSTLRFFSVDCTSYRNRVCEHNPQIFSVDCTSYRNRVCEHTSYVKGVYGQCVNGGYGTNDISVCGKTWPLWVFLLMCRNMNICGASKKMKICCK